MTHHHTHKQTLRLLAAGVAAALVAPAAHAIDLLPTVPVVHSETWARTYQQGTVYLNDIDDTYPVDKTNDSRYNTATGRGETAAIGNLNGPAEQLLQYDDSITEVRAAAQSDFGVNKVWAQMSGAAAPHYYRAYGSMVPTDTYASRYIGAFDYGNASLVYDDVNTRNVWVPNSITVTNDPNTNELVFSDATGAVKSTPWGGSEGEHFFVPSAPEVEVDLGTYRYVQAYSRWEDMFYFHGAPGSGATGVATVHVQLDGTLDGTDAGAGLQFVARDWAHKDTWGTFLASEFQWVTTNGQSINKDLTLEITFEYDKPAYIKAEAWAYLYGEGNVDFFNTARITSIDVPEGTVVYDYGLYLFGGTGTYAVNGGTNGNGLPNGGTGYFTGGGGGGGGNPVPLPASVWLLLSAAGALAGLRRRT